MIEWTKWSNNGKFIKTDAAGNEVDPILQTFSHFTYTRTLKAKEEGKMKEAMMILDVHGVRQGKDFLLTDPAVVSESGSGYGDSNTGKSGMKDWFNSHKCSEHCAKLGLARPVFA